MSKTFQKLRRRVEIREPVQTPNITTGGFDKQFKVKATVWSEVLPISFGSRAIFIKAGYIRDKQLSDGPTHTFLVRRSKSLGVDFRGENPLLGGNYYLWLKEGEDKGRQFRIIAAVDQAERGELIMVLAMEEEQQTSRTPWIFKDE